MTKRLGTIVLALVPIAMTAQSGPPAYHVFDLGTLGGATSSAQGINDAGDIAGWSESAAGIRACVWRRGKVIDLGVLPGGTRSSAFAINNAGDVVGFSDVPGERQFQPVRWRRGRIIELRTLGGDCGTTAVNNVGQVVGSCDTPDGWIRAMLWDHGRLTDLGTLPGGTYSVATGINDRGQIVGWSNDPTSQGRAVRWQNGAITDLGATPGPYDMASATGINSRGQIVGWKFFEGPEGFTYRGFVWDHGTVSERGTFPGGHVSYSYAINNRGQVTGASDNAAREALFAVVADARVTIKLPSFGGQGGTGLAINDRGDVVGQGPTPSGTHALLWTRSTSHALGGASSR